MCYENSKNCQPWSYTVIALFVRPGLPFREGHNGILPRKIGKVPRKSEKVPRFSNLPITCGKVARNFGKVPRNFEKVPRFSKNRFHFRKNAPHFFSSITFCCLNQCFQMTKDTKNSVLSLEIC